MGIAATVLVLGGGAGYYFGVMKPQADAARLAAADPQSSAAATQAAVPDPAPAAPSVDSAAILAQLKLDSVAKAFEARLEQQRRQDSIRSARALAKAAETRQKSPPPAAPVNTRSGGTETQAAPVQQAAPDPEPQVPAALPTGLVFLGSTTPGAVLYINGATEGSLTALRNISVPAGSVRLTIRAPGCEPWDSIVTVPGGTTVRIGRRFAKCP
jgi:hypothetical protein